MTKRLKLILFFNLFKKKLQLLIVFKLQVTSTKIRGMLQLLNFDLGEE